VTNGLKRRVLRSWEKEAVLQQAHASPTSAHFRVAATTKKLKKRFWWPNMFQEIKEFVESCDACQRKNPAVKSQPLHPIKVTGPFDRIGIDIVGRLPKSKRGNQYIIVAVDYFTKWPEARAIEDIKASTVAQFIFEDIIARHGCPKEIQTDRGRSFHNLLIKDLCDRFHIKYIPVSPYHPQANGMVERLNGTICTAIAKFVQHDVRE